jgi:hypothetical protein
VKIHKASGKVTFLVYDDYEGKPLPELQHRIKVNLKTRWVQAFDHRGSGQLLYFKERFLSPDHPRLGEMAAFSLKLRKLGVTEPVGFRPARPAAVGHPRGNSRRLQYRVVRLPSRVGEGRPDVVRFEIREVPQDLLVGHALGQHAENIGDADAHPADAGPPATFVRLGCDPFQQFHAFQRNSSPAGQPARAQFGEQD